jgi:hypothetical protein
MRRFCLPALAVALLSLSPSAPAQPPGKVNVVELSLVEMVATIREAQASGDNMVLVYLYNSQKSDDDFKTVNQMAKEYRSRGLTVLAFSTDAKSDGLEEMLAGVKPLNVPAYWVQGATITPLKKQLAQWGPKNLIKIPYAALIGRDGKVEKEWAGENQIGECQDYLDRNLPQNKSDKGGDTVKVPADKLMRDKEKESDKDPAADPNSLAAQVEKQTPPWVPMLIGAAVAAATLVVGFGTLRK